MNDYRFENFNIMQHLIDVHWCCDNRDCRQKNNKDFKFKFISKQPCEGNDNDVLYKYFSICPKCGNRNITQTNRNFLIDHGYMNESPLKFKIVE